MCRRFLSCSLFLLFCCCLVLPVGASDVPEDDLQVDAAAVPEDDPGIDLQAGGRYSYGYIGMNPDDGVIMVTEGTAIGSKVLASLDLKQFMADQGYLTAANLTQVERYLSEISNKLTLIKDDLSGYIAELSAKLSLIYDQLSDANTSLSSISSLITTTNSNLITIANRINTTNSTLATISNRVGVVNGYLGGTSSGPLTDIRDRLVASPDTFYDSASNVLTPFHPVEYTLTELFDVRSVELEKLLLKNFGTSRSFQFMAGFGIGQSSSYPGGLSLLELLSSFFQSFYNDFGWEGPGFLMRDGSINAGGYRQAVSYAFLVGNGLVGLSTNMEKALVGGHGGSASYEKLTFDSKLNKVRSTVSYEDLLHALVGLGSDLQNPVSQLQAVLAGDDDLELRQNVQDNVGSVTDNFTGDGAGAVSTGDISGAAGLTSGVGDAYGGNPVSVGDVFSTAGDSDNWNFFSEESAMSMDAVSYPAPAVLTVGDDYLDDFVADEDGFYSLGDQSGWNLFDYLGKEG